MARRPLEACLRGLRLSPRLGYRGTGEGCARRAGTRQRIPFKHPGRRRDFPRLSRLLRRGRVHVEGDVTRVRDLEMFKELRLKDLEETGEACRRRGRESEACG